MKATTTHFVVHVAVDAVDAVDVFHPIHKNAVRQPIDNFSLAIPGPEQVLSGSAVSPASFMTAVDAVDADYLSYYIGELSEGQYLNRAENVHRIHRIHRKTPCQIDGSFRRSRQAGNSRRDLPLVAIFTTYATQHLCAVHAVPRGAA